MQVKICRNCFLDCPRLRLRVVLEKIPTNFLIIQSGLVLVRKAHCGRCRNFANFHLRIINCLRIVLYLPYISTDMRLRLRVVLEKIPTNFLIIQSGLVLVRYAHCGRFIVKEKAPYGAFSFFEV
jgi:hypothetical protein